MGGVILVARISEPISERQQSSLCLLYTSKRNCILSGGLVTIAGNLLVLISKTNLAGILAGTVLCGIGLGLGMGVTFVMGAETVDYSEWQTRCV